METQRKPLLKKQTSVELEIVDGEQRIYVNTEDSTKSWLQLCENTKTQSQCPVQINNLADRKYKTYQIIERFACNGDTITAQGKLTRHLDGRLFVKSTGRLKFPSFVTVQTQCTDGQFAKEVAGKSLRDARNKQINIAALVINALLLFY